MADLKAITMPAFKNKKSWVFMDNIIYHREKSTLGAHQNKAQCTNLLGSEVLGAMPVIPAV